MQMAYTEILKDFTQKLLELINSARQQYIKLTYENFLHYFYTTNGISERECKKIPLKIAPSKKYLGVNLAKEVEDLYAENYKI